MIQKNQLLEFLKKDGNPRREETIPNKSSDGGQVRIINTIHDRTNRHNSSSYGLCSSKRMGEDLKEVCTLQKEQIRRKKIAQISFGEEDLERVQTPHEGPLVVTLRVHDCDVQRILMDGGSSANILFLETFKKFWLDESQIQRSS